MRATCERCAQPQPPEWRPGDLCVRCGAAVRHELRCCWCATWTPEGRYCRTCGAEVVAETLYGAARMLKDAGVDRFTIPAQLAAMDPEQIDNFTRIYQRQAVVAGRHVEQLAYVQRHLRHQEWVGSLDDRLTAELPWSAEVLAAHDTAPVDLHGDDVLGALAAIGVTTPIAITRALAPVARLRLDDWDAFTDAVESLHNDDAAVRDEAALALTSWRAVTMGCAVDDVQAIFDALSGSPFVFEAALRRAALRRGGPVELPATPPSMDRETTIALALVTGDLDVLRAALQGDSVERCAAGEALIRVGALDGLGRALVDGPGVVQLYLLRALSLRRAPVPDLIEALLTVLESTDDPVVRELAVRVASASLHGDHLVRATRFAAEDRRILQSLLQRTSLTAEEMTDFLDRLIETGLFAGTMPGMTTVVEAGRVPLAFVPARLPAAAPAGQVELLALAELQLEQATATPADVEQLHCFVMSVVFGDVATGVRTAAWWVLHRWYQHQGDHRGNGPLRLDAASVERFFRSPAEHVLGLTRVVLDGESLAEVAFADFAADLLASADDAWIADVQAREHDGANLVAALRAGVRIDDRANVQESMIVLLSQLATVAAWRPDALAAIRATGRAGNFQVDRAIERLEPAEPDI